MKVASGENSTAVLKVGDDGGAIYYPGESPAGYIVQVESMQRRDGSWLNERNPRWYEGLDILCTCYALISLEHC